MSPSGRTSVSAEAKWFVGALVYFVGTFAGLAYFIGSWAMGR
jgi:hypothetical protein